MNQKNFDKYLRTLNIYDVLVLNLKNKSDRLSFMKFKLNSVNINNYKVFEAVNGYSEENMEIYEKYKCINKSKQKIIKSPGAMGCIMSYKKMFKMYLDDPNFKEDDKLFIMEDDINFHKNFNEEFMKYDHLIKTSDIAYVGAN